ncbi:MAG: 4Fe-4S binding protein [Thermodesulfobacteriota bacterium]|nr:4Fe-4S binding protein [Thermodesulfobacteriota bacterium]
MSSSLWVVQQPGIIKPPPEIITRDVKCIKFGKCFEACPKETIAVMDNTRTVNWEKCDQCMKCAEVCPSKSIELAGKYISVEEVLDTVERDASYYRRTDGGMTVSGGEPLVQSMAVYFKTSSEGKEKRISYCFRYHRLCGLGSTR